ncbi:preprotein translocase subunit SecG [Sulfuriroseicoccus oceanibius]|uniref:Protein-export membrane protein SecG n=1 Tax=Sulfuriroseicoccus oceanibius TaxID=2707525 RepID=A0A6B3LFQ6_9BACT|nr:preprotein translocase subunit SecG [Sulfuriroseicoccus oceanibius]QQL46026.1 preprotein translocase subunit SecG [Sulfuriroseicoccus oceanibius]
MSIVITILAVFQVVGSLLMLLIILMQRPKQEGLGASFGANMTQDLFGAQTTNVLQKATTWLAVFFFVNTVVLAVLITRQDNAAKDASAIVAGATPAVEEVAADAAVAPAADDNAEAPAAQ